MTEILSTKGLTVRYPYGSKQFTAVDGIDLTIESGEIVGLIGESGSGKSSLALALLALARNPGTLSGEVYLNGQQLIGLSDDQLRNIRGKAIGLITQKPRQSLNPFQNIGTQIKRVFQAHTDATDAQAEQQAVTLLESVGINDAERRLKAYPHELSGGMAQRALISMALSAHPDLLIADEPTSGLDVTIQAQFLDRMWERAKQDRTAVLLVTQDLGIVANYCDRVLVMEQGKIVEDLPTGEFFANPQDSYSKRVLALVHERQAAKTATSSDEGEVLLQVEDLTKTFTLHDKQVLQAVSKVSFSVRQGRSLGLVGESGSGKTTVGRLILRLLDADSGDIEFRGQQVRGLKGSTLKSFRSRVQVVFQDPFDSLNPRWTVERILSEPIDLHLHLDAAAKKARILELLGQVGLPESALGIRPAGLSAGQQQRVCLARALATSPDFLVLDEPTSALPPAARVEMIGLLRRLQEQLQLSFILISHDLSTVRELCQDVAVMYLSQVVEVGSTTEVFSNPKHPYTRALLNSVLFPDPNDRRVDRADREDLSGEIPSPIDLPKGCYLAGRCPLVEERCTLEPQVLAEIKPGHLVRCWKATGA